MPAVMQIESTEFVYFGVTGTAPSVSAEVAFLPSGQRPTSGDWHAASLVLNNVNPLWADALASGVKGTYYVAVRVGLFASGTIDLTNGDYQTWLRLTGTSEQHVILAQTLTVQG